MSRQLRVLTLTGSQECYSCEDWLDGLKSDDFWEILSYLKFLELTEASRINQMHQAKKMDVV